MAGPPDYNLRKVRKKVIDKVVNKLIYYKYDLLEEVEDTVWDAETTYEEHVANRRITGQRTKRLYEADTKRKKVV